MANRLVDPSAGVVRVDGNDVRTVDPVALRRRIGYVIQNVGLLPHRTVAENVGLTPKLIGMSTVEIAERVDGMLALVRLDPQRYRHRYPAELSGGEAQRVGVARALAARPKLVLMDEPFGAVDPINRTAIRTELMALHRALGGTVLFVSHDVGEAFAIADRIVLMREGRIVAEDNPLALLTSTDPYVKAFLGDADSLALDALQVAHALIPLPDGRRPPLGGTISARVPLRAALLRLLRAHPPCLLVTDDIEAVRGMVTIDSIGAALVHRGGSTS